MTSKKGISYFGNRILRHFKEDLKDIKKHGCNLIVHTFSENDAEFYKDTMKDFVDSSHKAKMEVWLSPWGVCGLFGGEAYSKLALTNYKYRQVSNTGKLVPAICLNKKGTKKLMKQWIDDAAYTGTDYIMWDEPHFYGHPKEAWQTWCCRCKTCSKLYKQMYKKEMPKLYTEEVKKFKELSIQNFIREMSRYTKKKGLKVSTVLTIWDMDNAERMMKVKEIDIVTCDPYWGKKGISCDKDLDVEEFVKPYAQTLVELGKKYKKKVLGWVQAFDVTAGTEEDVRIAIKTLQEAGIKNISVWGYEGCKHMSELSCGNADKVWKIIGEEYRKIK